MALLTALKILLLAILFVISGGALFTDWAKKHKLLVLLASIFSIAAAYYLFRDIYNDLKRDVSEDLTGPRTISTESPAAEPTVRSYRDDFTASSHQAKEFRLKRGESSGAWTYTNEGYVRLNGDSITSIGILFYAADVPEVMISQPTDDWAAVVGYDQDGLWKYYVVDIEKKRSVVSSGPPHKIYWSPNLKYLVAFTAYEGAAIERVGLEQLDIKRTKILTWHNFLMFPRDLINWSTDEERFLAVTDVTTNPWEDPTGKKDPASPESWTSVPTNTFILEVRLRDLAITVHESPLSDSN
jgi:hypothetical protein